MKNFLMSSRITYLIDWLPLERLPHDQVWRFLPKILDLGPPAVGTIPDKYILPKSQWLFIHIFFMSQDSALGCLGYI